MTAEGWIIVLLSNLLTATVCLAVIPNWRAKVRKATRTQTHKVRFGKRREREPKPKPEPKVLSAEASKQFWQSILDEEPDDERADEPASPKRESFTPEEYREHRKAS